jgi:hypothetical protein
MRAAAMVDDGPEFEKHIPIAVRETRSLFRLTPRAPAVARAGRVEAIVAADSAEEARTITSLHDPHGNDWKRIVCVVLDDRVHRSPCARRYRVPVDPCPTISQC